MEVFFIVAFVVVFVSVAFYSYKKSRVSKREKLIDEYRFPESICDKLKAKYPHLSANDTEVVMHGLREYFHICNIAGKRVVSMPSQVVDVAWHEFILFTKQYDHFCHRSLGRFLHHTPAEAMSSPTMAQDGIKTAWRIACHRESIKADKPQKLPFLFSMDDELNIPDGFRYSLDCSDDKNNAYCASHIGCGSCSSCSSGCSSGCGGGD